MLNVGSEDLKFSTEVIIPHKTNHYSDLRDREEPFQYVSLDLGRSLRNQG